MLGMAKRKRANDEAAETSSAMNGGETRRRALAADLMAEVSREDRSVFSADEIAGFVARADDALSQHRPGEPTIVVADTDVEATGKHTAVTAVTLVNDDMPFLLDSVLGELHEFGAEVLLVAHPMVYVRRRPSGGLAEYLGAKHHAAGDGVFRESLIQILVAGLSAEARTELEARLARVLAHVRRAVGDWRQMQERLRRAIEAYRADPPPDEPDELAEAIAFLDWLLDGNFTFLGMREYDFVGGAGRGQLQRAERPSLGILADPDVRVLQRGGEPVHTTPAIREFLMRPDPLIITKSNTRSLVHRRGYMDYIGVKRYAGNGALAGELRIVGLFTSTAYTRSARSIPYIRSKIERVIARAAYDPASHSGKALVNILETYPREELFQIDEDTLFASASGRVFASSPAAIASTASSRSWFSCHVTVTARQPASASARSSPRPITAMSRPRKPIFPKAHRRAFITSSAAKKARRRSRGSMRSNAPSPASSRPGPTASSGRSMPTPAAPSRQRAALPASRTPFPTPIATTSRLTWRPPTLPPSSA
jgi:glutamate dehydrogenase